MSKIVGIIADFVENDNSTLLKTPFYRIRGTYVNYLQNNNKQDIVIVFIPYLQNKIDEYTNLCDGILLVGGDDLPPETYGETKLFDDVCENNARYKFELEFIRKYLKTNKPILGICAGMQSINVALGGNLYQDINKQIKTTINHSQKSDFSQSVHEVFIEKNSKLFDILEVDKISTNSMHHQAVKKLGTGLNVGAKTADGIIEEIELRNHNFCVGIQWHAEFYSCDYDVDICKRFCSCL